MNKCNIAFLIGFIPFCIYGIFSPFTGSYLIFLYTFYIFLNFFYFLVATHMLEIFIILYFIIACIVGAVLFFSVLHYVYTILIVLLGALGITFILYNTVKPKYFRDTLIATQALFVLLISFTLLNLNILHMEPTGLHIFHPLVVFNTGPFVLFEGYSTFNIGKLLNDDEILWYSFVSPLALLYLALGITILLFNYKLPILAVICLVLGLIATVLVFCYLDRELINLERKNRRKKKQRSGHRNN